jgi:hypothetical protein
MDRRVYDESQTLVAHNKWLLLVPQDRRGHMDLPQEGIFTRHAPIECTTEMGRFCHLPYYLPVTELFPPRLGVDLCDFS